MSDDDGADVTTITVYPDGPLLVRGPARIRTPQGEEFVNTRAVRALCRCGKSASKPWCDGTHKVARFRAPQEAPDAPGSAGTPSA
jgi:CDGSH-type Zn-finger protein